MSDLVDLMDATQTAVIAQLSSSAELTRLTTVTQHVLAEGMGWPITRFGKIESEPVGGKDEQVEQILFDIETLYRGQGQAAVLAIMHQQRLALAAGELQHPGVILGEPEWQGGAVDGPGSDGVTYVGLQTFIITAEAA